MDVLYKTKDYKMLKYINLAVKVIQIWVLRTLHRQRYALASDESSTHRTHVYHTNVCQL